MRTVVAFLSTIVSNSLVFYQCFTRCYYWIIHFIIVLPGTCYFVAFYRSFTFGSLPGINNRLYLFLSVVFRAFLIFCENQKETSDVMHCNDWLYIIGYY